MLLKSTLRQIVEAQRENFLEKNTGLERKLLKELPELSTHALIVSGIRRCGKSTLVLQLLLGKYPGAFYLNFEDPRLYGFEINDFTRLDEIIQESKHKVLIFDEIQIINEWERYIRQKLDEGHKIVITGSNASMLSKELGTKLTGRHLTKELFPFSFQEYCSFKNVALTSSALLNYLKIGGLPEYIKTEEVDILKQLFDDILVRDIAVRYGVRDIKSLKRLALYLISNIGTRITGNSLKKQVELASTSSVLEHISHLEYAYLIFLIPKFSYSIKKQNINPKKVYAIDTGLINTNSLSFTEDFGRKFENLIFLHVRRKYEEIYYFSEKGECDFIACEKGKVLEVIQVCFRLNQDNLDQEINGLFEALEFFNMETGVIITMDQEDRFEREGKIAKVIPAHLYL